MRIILAEHFGMCFGVRDAIAEAEQLASAGSLTVLGELVHNPVVRERLTGRGIREGALDDFASAATQQVMITAHGASDMDRSAWRAAGFTSPTAPVRSSIERTLNSARSWRPDTFRLSLENQATWKSAD